MIERILVGAVLLGASGVAMARQAPASLVRDPVEGRADVSRMLGKAREECGVAALEALPRGLVVRGKCQRQGLTAGFEIRFDGQGRFLFHVDGRLSTTLGFDGERGWERDYSDTPRELGLDEILDTLAWFPVQTGLWLGERSPFQVTRGPAEETQKYSSVELSTDTSPLRFQVRLDPNTALPLGMTWSTLGDVVRVRFEDYRPVLGVQLAHSVLLEYSEGGVEEYTVTEVEAAGSLAEDPYAPDLELPEDFFYDSEVSAEIEVRRAPSGHHLIRPTINSTELNWFILDTGASVNTINRSAAERLGLDALGSLTLHGVGGATQARYRQAEDLTLGPLTQFDPVFVETDTDFLTGAFGVKIDGVLGYPVLSRAVFDIDVARAEVIIHDHREYELAEGAWQDLRLIDRLPCVRARFEGDREGWFLIDTGAAGSSLVMHGPAVERFQLLEGRRTTPRQVGGVGGSITVAQGRLEFFEFAGNRIENLSTAFATAERGAMGAHLTLGNIGGLVLQRFRMITDYPGRRIAFVER